MSGSSKKARTDTEPERKRAIAPSYEDLKIVCDGGEEILFSSQLLALRSPVFKQMLFGESNMAETETAVVSLDHSLEVVETVKDWLISEDPSDFVNTIEDRLSSDSILALTTYLDKYAFDFYLQLLKDEVLPSVDTCFRHFLIVEQLQMDDVLKVWARSMTENEACNRKKKDARATSRKAADTQLYVARRLPSSTPAATAIRAAAILAATDAAEAAREPPPPPPVDPEEQVISCYSDLLNHPHVAQLKMTTFVMFTQSYFNDVNKS